MTVQERERAENAPAGLGAVAAMLLVHRDIAFIGMVVVVWRFIIAGGRADGTETEVE